MRSLLDMAGGISICFSAVAFGINVEDGSPLPAVGFALLTVALTWLFCLLR